MHVAEPPLLLCVYGQEEVAELKSEHSSAVIGTKANQRTHIYSSCLWNIILLQRQLPNGCNKKWVSQALGSRLDL